MSSLVADLKRGLPVTNERRTVGELLEEWLVQSASSSIRASTYRSYRDIVRLHLVPEIGGISLAKLQPHHIERLLQHKLASGLSRRRVQYIHAVLRRALGRGVRWGVLGRNVATLVDAPRPARPEVVPFTPQEIARLLVAVEGDRLEASSGSRR
jgi:integrase